MTSSTRATDPPAPETDTAEPETDAAETESLLVEEISIDGMCGVY